MKTKLFLITILVSIAACTVMSLGLTASLTAPSSSMKAQEGIGFILDIPANWSMDTFPSGMSYFAAADGKRVTRDADGTNVSVLLGLAAGYRKTNFQNARDAADQTIRFYQSDNPGLRVILREAAKLGGFPPESVLIESPTGRDGEMERSLMLITAREGQMFMAAFTSPANDYKRLQRVFVQIADSIRLTAWQKGKTTPGRPGTSTSKKR
ncbi:MAG TPA: hypothetical protein PKK52_04830 [Syntrophorhabdus sp.]|nr:hypothetical protein [Syntrophorhabdus sp.]